MLLETYNGDLYYFFVLIYILSLFFLNLPFHFVVEKRYKHHENEISNVTLLCKKHPFNNNEAIFHHIIKDQITTIYLLI